MDHPVTDDFNDILSRLASLESRWTVSRPRTLSMRDKDYSSMAEAILQDPERRLTKRECLYLFGDDRVIGTQKEVLYFDSELVDYHFNVACSHCRDGSLARGYFEQLRGILHGW